MINYTYMLQDYLIPGLNEMAKINVHVHRSDRKNKLYVAVISTWLCSGRSTRRKILHVTVGKSWTSRQSERRENFRAGCLISR